MGTPDVNAGSESTSVAQKRRGATVAFVSALSTAAGFAVFFSLQIPGVSAGVPLLFSAEWIPRLGVNFALRLDGLSLLFSLLISGIGVLVVLYSHGYFKKHSDHARLQWLLLAFMLSMLGLVNADNIIVLFVFWELTTITSFLLVGFDRESEKARASALQALLVTGGGGLALLVGLLMLGNASDRYA